MRELSFCDGDDGKVHVIADDPGAVLCGRTGKDRTLRFVRAWHWVTPDSRKWCRHCRKVVLAELEKAGVK